MKNVNICKSYHGICTFSFWSNKSYAFVIMKFISTNSIIHIFRLCKPYTSLQSFQLCYLWKDNTFASWHLKREYLATDNAFNGSFTIERMEDKKKVILVAMMCLPVINDGKWHYHAHSLLAKSRLDHVHYPFSQTKSFSRCIYWPCVFLPCTLLDVWFQ